MADSKLSRRPSTRLPVTPWHTLGPFYPWAMLGKHDHDLGFVRNASTRARGERVVIEGRVFEKNRAPRVNAVIEIWQADAAGRFAHPLDRGQARADPQFMGWGRCKTDRDGRYRFITVKPAGYDDPLTKTRRAPHINFTILSSGLMMPLSTTLFFPGEPDNAGDVVLNAVPDRARRKLLVANPGARKAGGLSFRFDIVLRGPGETPFFVD